VTDGRSTSPTATAAAAAALRAVVPQITVFAIGITAGIDQDELELIASEPSTTFVRTIASFDATELQSVTQALLLQACQGIL